MLRVDNTLTATRDYAFNCSAPINGLSVNLVTATNELQAAWQDPKNGQTEYDLEWAWVDESAYTTYQNTSGQFLQDKIFEANATRVTVSSTTYSIPLMYDGDGKLFVRVRPAQIKNDGQRIEGLWTWQNGGNPVDYAYTGHETI